jgi:hypothetical protein
VRVCGQVEHRLAERLRRNGAGIYAYATDHVPPIHHGDPRAELRGRDGRLLTGRGAEHHDVEVAHDRQCAKTNASGEEACADRPMCCFPLAFP